MAEADPQKSKKSIIKLLLLHLFNVKCNKKTKWPSQDSNPGHSRKPAQYPLSWQARWWMGYKIHWETIYSCREYVLHYDCMFNGLWI